jgi:hypothetical protein
MLLQRLMYHTDRCQGKVELPGQRQSPPGDRRNPRKKEQYEERGQTKRGGVGFGENVWPNDPRESEYLIPGLLEKSRPL